MEMVAALVYQLTRNMTIDDIKAGGFDAYFVDHTNGIYPVSASGVPFSVLPIASKGDIVTDLHEDLAADAAYLQKQQSPGIRPKPLSQGSIILLNTGFIYPQLYGFLPQFVP